MPTTTPPPGFTTADGGGFKPPADDEASTVAWRHVGALLDAGHEDEAIGIARSLVLAGCHGRRSKLQPGVLPEAKTGLRRLAPLLRARGLIREPPPVTIKPAAQRRNEAHHIREATTRAIAAALGTVDVSVQDLGSIVLLVPLTDDARAWCDENLPADATRHGHAYVIEHRYAPPIVTGMERDGLTVKGDDDTEAQGLTRVGGTPKKGGR